MKYISLTFQVHHPVRLRRYHFFDIGKDNYYFDDFDNEHIIQKSAEEYYLPVNRKLQDLLTKYNGQFKVAFAISGTAIDLFSIYAPEVIESFRKLSGTGCVEFLAETYSHSLASLKDTDEFKRQVGAHVRKIEKLFGQKPVVFKNTGLIYSDRIGEELAEMGFKAVLTEGDRHILRWRSPNHLYSNPINPELKILFKNGPLNEDIAFRLSNPGWTGWPSTAGNYLASLNRIPEEERVVNLFMDYETVCKGQKIGKGSYNFLEWFPQALFEMTEFRFMTPSEIADEFQPLSSIDVPEPVTRCDKENDFIACKENELQQEAVDMLYELKDRITRCRDTDLLKDWQYLQSSDHFYYMSSRFFSKRDYHHDINPYNNPYEAFMNYMNVLSDFTIRLNNATKRKKGYPPIVMRSIRNIAAAS